MFRDGNSLQNSPSPDLITLQGCAAAWSMAHGMAWISIDGRTQAMVDTDQLQETAYAITRQLNLEVLMA